MVQAEMRSQQDPSGGTHNLLNGRRRGKEKGRGGDGRRERSAGRVRRRGGETKRRGQEKTFRRQSGPETEGRLMHS